MSERIVGLDIETTHLKGNMGHVLVAVAQPLGGKPITWRIDKTPGFGKTAASFVNDSEIVREIIQYIADKADVIVTHYGERFDVPFLNTRALHWKLAPMAPVAHLDLWKSARKNLALTSNRQATVNDLVGADHSKYKPGWEVWRRAQYGDKKALDELAAYCRNDVAGLLDNYRALRPLIINHPYLTRRAEHACAACGSTKVQARGYRRTKRQRIQRLHCQDCGSWFDGTREKV